MIRKGLVIAVILLFVGITVFPSIESETVEKLSTLISNGNILYVGGTGPGNYSVIQDAIDNASNGDTVFVYDDSAPYYEHTIINKSINLIGENRDTTIIDGSGNGTVVYISGDYVNITGFTIQNCGPHPYSGIESVSLFNCISYNDIISNWYGIRMRSGCHNNTIKYNHVVDGNVGIYMSGTNGNLIIGNNASSQNHQGISIYACCNNTVTGNNVESNTNNLGIYIRYYSLHNTISGNNVSNNEKGIKLESHADHNIISGNNVYLNHEYGIRLEYADYTNVIGNTVSDNVVGISLFESRDNLFYHNNLINNSQNAFDNNRNVWYNSTHQRGNYYDDYTGEDNDSNGIGDTPYSIPPSGNNLDLYPLMEPYIYQDVTVELHTGFFVKVVFVNEYESGIFDVVYQIKVRGGIFNYLNKDKNGMLDYIGPGKNKSAIVPIIGIGPITIEVIIGNGETFNFDATVLFIYVFPK